MHLAAFPVLDTQPAQLPLLLPSSHTSDELPHTPGRFYSHLISSAAHQFSFLSSNRKTKETRMQITPSLQSSPHLDFSSLIRGLLAQTTQSRTTEWVGLEGTLEIISFQPPAKGRDTSWQSRLFPQGAVDGSSARVQDRFLTQTPLHWGLLTSHYLREEKALPALLTPPANHHTQTPSLHL